MDQYEFHTVRGYQLMDRESRLLTPAMEDYMEMIYRYVISEGYVRINTLSELLNVRPSSSTKMVQKLAKVGLLKYQKYGIITLTQSGKEIGEYLLKRHNIIKKFLGHIGIEEYVLKETELIEHNVSISTLECMELFNRFLHENEDVMGRFIEFRKNDSNN